MSGPIVDPDLVRALDELRMVVERLPQFEEQMILPTIRQHAKQFEHVMSVRAGLLDAISGRAKQLHMRPGTLRLMVELSNDYRAKTRRRIPLDHLRRQTSTVLEAMKRRSLQAQADFAIAEVNMKAAAEAVNEARDGVQYLDASRAEVANG